MAVRRQSVTPSYSGRQQVQTHQGEFGFVVGRVEVVMVMVFSCRGGMGGSRPGRCSG
jgi:hypothetical protein